jgi:hypothetical protein
MYVGRPITLIQGDNIILKEYDIVKRTAVQMM